jgi:hypothetical protein
MQTSCRQCSATFDITADDLAFLDKVSPVFAGKKELIPPPTLCPDCRQQRRMVYYNMIYVYSRPSSSSGQPIFSMFDADAPVPVLPNEEWWGDGWDPHAHGRTFDASRSFLDQLRELSPAVPRFARSMKDDENSEYSNNATGLKNCYFVFHATNGEDGMYCESMTHSRDCIDSSYTLHSELCYDCIWCTNCYHVQNALFCDQCSDSFFLRYCIGCTHCIGCVNLRHREYCIFNEQKTPEEYHAFLQSIALGSNQQRRNFARQFHQFATQFPVPHIHAKQCENVTGTIIEHSRDVHASSFVQFGETLRHCFSLMHTKDCRDYTSWGNHAELVWDCISCGINIPHLAFCFECWDGCSNLLYCMFCPGSSDCFGCIGLKKQRYCILNVQYTKEEYERLVPQIIDHMRATGEWGEFFPISMSPYAYNHTIAQRYYPRTREQVEALGGRWIEETMPEAAQAIDASALPDGLPDTDDAIIVRSKRSGRPFKITSQEIKRYRQFQVPLPRLTYDERMEDRAAILGGITLYDRTCAKSGKPIRTTIPPESPWIVWDREEWERECGS